MTSSMSRNGSHVHKYFEFFILLLEPGSKYQDRISHKDTLTIKPQTFCGLIEIELKNMKIQQKDQQRVTIMQSRLALKK